MSFLIENACWLVSTIDENRSTSSCIIAKFQNKMEISQRKINISDIKNQRSKWLWICQIPIESEEVMLSTSEVYSQLRRPINERWRWNEAIWERRLSQPLLHNENHELSRARTTGTRICRSAPNTADHPGKLRSTWKHWAKLQHTVTIIWRMKGWKGWRCVVRQERKESQILTLKHRGIVA